MFRFLIATTVFLASFSGIVFGQLTVKDDAGNTLLKVTSDGKMGIGLGEDDPVEILEVNGGLRLIPRSTHDPTNEGTLYYDMEDDSVYIAVNGSWRGFRGPRGPEGPQGATGPRGTRGPTGATGPQGATGTRGPQGATGPRGTIGPRGTQGPAGPTGPQGPQGATGTRGPQGATGPRGTIGPRGTRGPAGPTGPQGPQGATGPRGTRGPTGATGPQGATGPRGTIGPRGTRGPTGPTGPGWPTNSAKIYRSSNLSISPSSAYTMHKVPMNATAWNNGGLYNSTYDCFRIPSGETGYYLVTATVAVSGINTGESFCVYITKSSNPSNLNNRSYIAGQGTTTYNMRSSGTAATSSHVSASFIANANDYVAIAVNSSDTDGYTVSNVVVKAHNSATMVFLGPS
jgi:hypothetical protein